VGRPHGVLVVGLALAVRWPWCKCGIDKRLWPCWREATLCPAGSAGVPGCVAGAGYRLAPAERSRASRSGTRCHVPRCMGCPSTVLVDHENRGPPVERTLSRASCFFVPAANATAKSSRQVRSHKSGPPVIEASAIIRQPRTGRTCSALCAAALKPSSFCFKQLVTWPGFGACPFEPSSPVRTTKETVTSCGFGLVAGSVLFRPARHWRSTCVEPSLRWRPGVGDGCLRPFFSMISSAEPSPAAIALEDASFGSCADGVIA